MGQNWSDGGGATMHAFLDLQSTIYRALQSKSDGIRILGVFP